MTENEYLRVILSFKESVVASIAVYNQETPRNNPLDVHICIGPKKPDMIREARKRLPRNTFLFYIAVESEGIYTDRYLIETGELTYITNWPESLVKDKVAVLVMLIGDNSPRLSILSDSDDQYIKAKEEVEKGIHEALSRKAQSRALNFMYFCNAISNVPLIKTKPSYSLPRIDMPVVVCSGGPSLIHNIGELKRNRLNYVMISVRRSLAILLDAGITPDFVVETDSLGLKYSDYEKIGSLDSVLVVITSASPYTPTIFKKIVWCEGECVQVDKTIKEQGGKLEQLAISHTCAITAIDLAVKMGCSKIALVGNDLGFSADHSEYSSNSSKRSFEDESLIEVPSTNGDKITSSPRYLRVKEYIEDYLQKLNDNKICSVANVIFNCTVRGVKLNGVNETSLATFFSQHTSCYSHKVLELTVNSSLSNCDPLETRYLDNFQDYVRLLQALTDSTRKLMRELTNSVIRENRVEEYQHDIRQKINDERQLFERLAGGLFSPVLEHRQTIVDEMHKFPKSTPLDELYHLARVYEWSYDLCDTVRIYIERIKKIPTYTDEIAFNKVEKRLNLPLKCDAYIRYAIRFVKKNNKEYADWLETYDPSVTEKNCFDIILKGCELPDVTWNDDLGQSYVVSHIDTIEKIARQTCHDFFTTSKFNPERNAIVLLGPGNWQYALEINRQYPDAYLIVLDPWPILFVNIIRSSMFLHRFWDERTVVIGMDRNMRSWKRVYHKIMRELSNRGLKPLFLKPRKIWEIPYVADAFDDPIFS